MALYRYEDFRKAQGLETGLLDFMQSAYDAGAKLSEWPWETLERRADRRPLREAKKKSDLLTEPYNDPVKRILPTLLLCSMVGACAGRGPRPTTPTTTPAPPPSPRHHPGGTGVLVWPGGSGPSHRERRADGSGRVHRRAPDLPFRNIPSRHGRGERPQRDGRGQRSGALRWGADPGSVYGAAQALDIVRRGVAQVRIEGDPSRS